MNVGQSRDVGVVACERHTRLHMLVLEDIFQLGLYYSCTYIVFTCIRACVRVCLRACVLADTHARTHARTHTHAHIHYKTK